MTPTQNTVLQAQLTQLGETMQAGFNELKALIQNVDQRVRMIETQEAGCQPLVNSRLAAVEGKVADHEKTIADLKTTITELKHTNKLLTWIGGIAGSALIIWFISQLTGLIK
jgi:hypothetical protein